MHVLIIEDEPDVRLEIKEFLQNSLYEFSTLDRFDHAAEEAVRIHPDLILLDLNLPGQSGFEVCSARKTCRGFLRKDLPGRTEGSRNVRQGWGCISAESCV